MSSAMTSMATALRRRPVHHRPLEASATSTTGRMRIVLRDRGAQTAANLAEAVGLKDTGRVGALLKHDLQSGRVLFWHGEYQLNPDYVEAPRGVAVRKQSELITWIPVEQSLPDADITVHVALANNDEPTWLGHFDGDQWIDVSGTPVEVTHWAVMLAGPERAPC